MFDVNASRPWSVGYKLRNIGHCIFKDLKGKLLQGALTRTRGNQRFGDVKLDNFKHTMSEDRRDTTPDTSECIFVQVCNSVAMDEGSVGLVCNTHVALAGL